MKEQKVMYTEVFDSNTNEIKNASFGFGINKAQWNFIKKKVDEEFDNDHGSYSEVRFTGEKNMIDIEGHMLLDRKRKN